MALGIGMIEMYIKMVQEEFGPLLIAAKSTSEQLHAQVKRELIVELGLDKLKAEIDRQKEIVAQMSVKYEEYVDKPYGKKSKLETLIEQRLKERYGENIEQKLLAAEKAAIQQVKLSGAATQVSEMFAKLPAQLEAIRIAMPKVTLLGDPTEE